jgi:hypothetical protein
MSKRIIGRYEDGSIKRSYFRKNRHHRIKRNGFLPIRWMMYVAKSWQIDAQLTLQVLKQPKQ